MSNFTEMPDYSDGVFELYKYTDSDDLYPVKELTPAEMRVCFQELSISDSLRAELNQNSIEVTMKIRIPQYKEIKPNTTVLKIDGELHQVYNVYHFTNKYGIKQSDITLQRFKYEGQ